MRRLFEILLASDSPDMLTRLLTAWRLWLFGAVAGAVLAAIVYALAPPPFRARATVLVDQNIEEAWTYFPDRQLFYYIERETRKLEEVAWGDDTLQVVANEAGMSISQFAQYFAVFGTAARGRLAFLGRGYRQSTRCGIGFNVGQGFC